MSREITMGIDVGTFAVKTVIVEKDGSSPRILGTGLSLSCGLRKGYIINPQDISTSVKASVQEAKEASGINIKNAFVSIGGVGLQGIKSKASIIVARADHEVTENDLKRAISQSEAQLNRNSSSYLLNREILQASPISYKIDGEPVMGNPVGMKAEKLEIETLFVTCLSQHLNNLIKSIELAGLNIEDITPAAYAMSGMLLNQREKEVGSLVVNIGGDTSTVIVFEEGSPISLEVFPIGSNHITYDIARGFQIPLHEAEDLKLAYGAEASLKRKLGIIIEPRLNDIFELIETHLNKINRNKLLPAGIILTGGGANLSQIEEVARKALVLPVQLGSPKPFEGLDHPIKDPIWSVALGLCAPWGTEENRDNLFTKTIGLRAKKTFVRWMKNLLP